MVFSADETCDVGRQAGSPVTDEYGPTGNNFTGKVKWVEIAIGADAADADHFLRPEERMQLAMGLQ
jgi:arylsulfatase